MPGQTARVYHKINDKEWSNAGTSMSPPVEIVESQTKTARGYKEQTSRTMSFVIAPLDKYPNELSSKELEALLGNQPKALNGLLE